jgi:hypothetical protein
LHNTCSCYYLHSQIDADKDSVFWLANFHPSSIQVGKKIGCISIPSKSVQETPTCRKKTVTWTNEMIEDLIDFIEIHPIVAFEAIYEPMLTSFWSLISFAVQLYITMQYKGQHPPLLPKMTFCLNNLPIRWFIGSKFVLAIELKTALLTREISTQTITRLSPGFRYDEFCFTNYILIWAISVAISYLKIANEIFTIKSIIDMYI